MLYIVGIVFTMFLVLILAGKKNQSTADIILACWLFFIGIHLLFYYFTITQINFTYPFLLGIEIPMPLLHGPFLFLYTLALTNRNWRPKVWLLHFIPFVIAVISIVPFYSLSSLEKIEVYQSDGSGFELTMGILYVCIVFSGVVYTLISLQRLVRYRRAINDYFSFTDKINLQWLLYLISGLSLIWVFVLIGNDEYIFTAVVIYVLFIGYFGIKQVGIFTNRLVDESHVGTINLNEDQQSATILLPHNHSSYFPNLEYVSSELPVEEKLPLESNILDEPVKIKYERSGLQTTDVLAIHGRLAELMLNEKLYKEPELTLADLAKRLEVHPNTLSQVINSVEQKNFFDYINNQRVNEFKAICLLPENHHFTLLSLAYECGFNSKTAFNRNFKKVTDLSPSAYLRTANIVLQ